MSIIITNQTPVSEIPEKIKIGKCQFDFDANEALIAWRLLSKTGSIMDNGVVYFSDKKTVATFLGSHKPQIVSEVSNTFTDFYNTGYENHEALEKKVVDIAGFSGSFQSEGLV